MSQLLVLVVRVLVHRTRSFQVSRLTGRRRGVLLELLAPVHHHLPLSLRSQLLNHDGELHVNLKSLRRPLVADRHIVRRPIGYTQSALPLLANVVHTVHHGEGVVAANVVGRGVDSLQTSISICFSKPSPQSGKEHSERGQAERKGTQR